MYKKSRFSGFISVYKGQLIEILRKNNSGKFKEIARRAPGVRMIIVDQHNRFLISRERRGYLAQKWDYRLPGGKVVDTLEEYLDILHSTNPKSLQEKIISAVHQEGKEEVGMTIHTMLPFHVSISGGTIDWDLHYFEIREFERGTQELHDDEDIEIIEMPVEDVIDLVLLKKMSEDRSRAVLIDYFQKYYSSELAKRVIELNQK